MANLGLAHNERMLEYECIDLLPDLEEDVLFADVLIPDLEESYVSGMEEWWPEFVFDMFP
ncbi:MAG: hypothetical protein LBS45_04200 [Synergistaceae bacterium]|nr:hypothetical protein [Synergistaceae bacterium]